jgi:hypothetical protein
LFNVPFSDAVEKPLSLAYGKDKIAISTTVSVKVWLLTPKGIQRSTVTVSSYYLIYN